MKRPTWATVVGILGIVFGLGGLFISVQMAVMPKTIKLQHEMYMEAKKNPNTDSKSAPDANLSTATIERIFGKQPTWFNSVAITMGFFGFVINGLYIFAAICLLLLRKYAVRLFYAVIALSIILAAARACIAVSAFSHIGAFISAFMLTTGIIGAVLDLVLLTVVLTGDKAAFRPQATSA